MGQRDWNNVIDTTSVTYLPRLTRSNIRRNRCTSVRCSLRSLFHLASPPPCCSCRNDRSMSIRVWRALSFNAGLGLGLGLGGTGVSVCHKVCRSGVLTLGVFDFHASDHAGMFVRQLHGFGLDEPRERVRRARGTSVTGRVLTWMTDNRSSWACLSAKRAFNQ